MISIHVNSICKSLIVISSDYMLRIIMFIPFEGKYKSSAPNIFHVVMSVCSYC